MRPNAERGLLAIHDFPLDRHGRDQLVELRRFRRPEFVFVQGEMLVRRRRWKTFLARAARVPPAASFRRPAPRSDRRKRGRCSPPPACRARCSTGLPRAVPPRPRARSRGTCCKQRCRRPRWRPARFYRARRAGRCPRPRRTIPRTGSRPRARQSCSFLPKRTKSVMSARKG